MEKEEEKGTVREGEEGALVRRSHSPTATARFFAQTGRKNVQVQRNLHKVKTISSMWFQWYRLQFRIDIHQQVFCLCGTFARLQKNKNSQTSVSGCFRSLHAAATGKHAARETVTTGMTSTHCSSHWQRAGIASPPSPANTAGASHRDCIRARRAL